MIIFNIIYIFVSVCLSIVWDTNWITGTNPWCMDGPTLSIEPLNKPTGNASTLYNSTIQLETNGIINRSIDQWNWTFGQALTQVIVRVLLVTNVFWMLPFPANISTSQSYLQSSRKPSAIHISMQNSWWNSNQNPEIYKLNISYTDKAKTWNVKVANWYICSNMVFQSANCLKMTVLIFYNPVLVKEAGLILSNGEIPLLVQNKTNPQLVFQAWPGEGLNKELA